MPASPEETRATSRPSAARSSARRTRASSSPSAAFVPPFAGDGRSEQVEIEAISDHVARRGERGARFRGAPDRVAGTDADDRQPAARPADRGDVDRPRRRGRWRRSHAAICALARRGFRRTRRRRARHPRPHPSSRSRGTPLPSARSEPFRLASRRAAGKNRAGTSSAAARAWIPGSASFRFDRDDGADSGFGETGFGQAVRARIGDLLGRTAALAADAKRQYRRMIDQRRGARSRCSIGHDDPGRERPLPRQSPLGAAIRRRRLPRSARQARRRAARRQPA